MKLPNWLRFVIWLALIGFLSWLLSQRYNSIIGGEATTTDIIILLVWIALITAFIFQEVDIFGVKLKREIDNLRTDFKKQIINLRSEIQNTINMRTDISPHITFLTPPPDSELPSIEERIRPILEQTLREQGIQKPVPTPDERMVSDDTKFLFSIRYTIESELRRLWEQWGVSEAQRHPRTHYQLINRLTELEIIPIQLYDAIREVYAICSSAIHGEKVSKNAVSFVRGVAPEIIVALKALSKTRK